MWNRLRSLVNSTLVTHATRYFHAQESPKFVRVLQFGGSTFCTDPRTRPRARRKGRGTPPRCSSLHWCHLYVDLICRVRESILPCIDTTKFVAGTSPASPSANARAVASEHRSSLRPNHLCRNLFLSCEIYTPFRMTNATPATHCESAQSPSG